MDQVADACSTYEGHQDVDEGGGFQCEFLLFPTVL